MSDLKKEYELWDEFLTVWPLTRLATMTLDDYSQAGSKDSFTYWIESRLDELGSITARPQRIRSTSRYH